MNIDKDKQLTNFVFPFNSIYMPVIPCVLDGNLSFLETVWKIMYDINKVVDAVNSNHDDILQLANEINNLINDKLSVLWVELDLSAKPIKANKTFAEIAEGMRKGIVFLTVGKNENKEISIPVAVTDTLIQFYLIGSDNAASFIIKSDESVTIIEYHFATTNFPTSFFANVSFNDEVYFNKHSVFAETTKFYKLITADSGITVPTATAASARTLAANLEYVGNACSETLTAAKSYTDTKCGETLTAAKEYSDTQDVAVQKAATIYTNTKCGETLAAAKTYADTQDATTLAAAKRYSDNHFSHITLTKNEDGTFSTDLAFSTIYLNIIRGVLCDVRYVPQSARNTVNVLNLSTYDSSNIVFVGVIDANTTHVCTISNDGAVTYT